MIAEPAFLNQPKDFWAYVRSVSQKIGYTVPNRRRRRSPDEPRLSGQIRVPTLAEITTALEALGLSAARVAGPDGRATIFGSTLDSYFRHRADVLNGFVEPRLMNRDKARDLFIEMQARLAPKIPIPMNKQKGEKKAPAFMTAIINMLIEANAGEIACDYDPRALTTVTRNGEPVRTLSRRVDGAFPCAVNPIAVWEIKEYYYTTTFGSRVADGVYESLLDGMELEELRIATGIDIKHYLMIDDHYTWWDCGRSYLCRIVDMLHMGYVDEVLFGSEVVERLPDIVGGWVEVFRSSR